MQQLEAFPKPKADKPDETKEKKTKGKGRGKGGGKGRGKGRGKGKASKVEKKVKSSGKGKGDKTKAKAKAKAKAKSKGSPKTNKRGPKEPTPGNKSWARRYCPKKDPAKTWYMAVKDSFHLHLHAQFAYPGQQEDSFESFC